MKSKKASAVAHKNTLGAAIRGKQGEVAASDATLKNLMNNKQAETQKESERLKREIEATIIEGDFESSITKGKTLLEEVMKYGIELKDKDLVTKKDDIDTIFSKFKNLYNMHQNKEQDKRINELLGGLEKIIKSISNMRNSNSDSHGVGSKRIRIKTHHAILYGNSAVTMAEFLLSVII